MLIHKQPTQQRRSKSLLIKCSPLPAEGFAPAELFQTEYILWRDEVKVLYDVPLGQGHFGMVFAGELLQEGEGVVRRVAVKTHSEHATHEMILEFLKEAAVMQYVSLSPYSCRKSCILLFI